MKLPNSSVFFNAHLGRVVQHQAPRGANRLLEQPLAETPHLGRELPPHARYASPEQQARTS